MPTDATVFNEEDSGDKLGPSGGRDAVKVLSF